MDKNIKNAYGYEMDFEAAYMYMDYDIRQKVDYLIGKEKGWEGDQWFFDTYCRLHEEKFGEEFELAKANPCW